MAQSSSAQRDPSMEEILASIRKIIEEGEETAPRVQSRDGNEPTAIGPAANDASRPLTPARTEAVRAEPVLASMDFKPFRAETIEPGPAAEARSPEPELTAETAASLEVATSLLATDDEHDLAIDEIEIEIEEADVRSVASSHRPSNIISETAGRQITASFSELMEALAVSRQRSLDQIAEEVLRPMLQDWVDNNLPTLVERLVREEIERVARGG